MDTLDMQILEYLRENARRPLTEISKSLGVSDVTVHTRVNDMIESGLIRGFTTVVDYEQIGYSVTAFVRLRTSPGNVDVIARTLEKHPWILEIHEISGEFDLFLKVKATNLHELRNRIVNELAGIGSVVGVDVIPVLNVRKESNLPLADLKAVRGESGVIHEFADVASDCKGVGKLIDRYDSEVTDREILISYIKACDVKSNCTEIAAPSYTKEAEELAKLYGIELKATGSLHGHLC